MIFALLFSAATSLIEPTLGSISDYNYLILPTNEVIKGDVSYGNSGLAFSPRYSTYENFKIVGIDQSILRCINGKNFTDNIVRAEDMLWLSEAFAERDCCTQGNDPVENSTGAFPLSVVHARDMMNNPLSRYRMNIIKKAPIDASASYVVVYRNGDAYPETPLFTDDTLIPRFGGDVSDPQDMYFPESNQVIKAQTPVRIDYIVEKIIGFLNDTQEVVVPGMSSLEEGTEKETVCVYPLEEYMSVTYDYSSHIPTAKTVKHYEEEYSSRTTRTSLPQFWKNIRYTKTNNAYLDEWNGSAKMYTTVTQYGVLTENKSVESVECTNAKVYAWPHVFTNVVLRGGENRLVTDKCAAIHMFTCTFMDSYNPTGIDAETQEHTVKYVFVCEPSTGQASLFHNVTNNLEYSYKNWGDYLFKSDLNIKDIMTSRIWNYAFPDKTYGAELEVADPPEPTYSDATEDDMKYGGAVRTHSHRETYYRVQYDGIWAGCCFMKFRTKGKGSSSSGTEGEGEGEAE